MKATMKKEMNNMAMFRIKAKAEFEVVIEAKNKKEANDWAEQVLTEIVGVDGEYSDRLVLVRKAVKVGKAKKEDEENIVG
jgi:hypothetical protein